jgi:hypothetical protein
MKFILLGFATLALTACGHEQGYGRKQLLSHDWAFDSAGCGHDFLRVTADDLEFHASDGPTSSLAVLNVVDIPEDPENVMLIVYPSHPTVRPADEDLGALLFELSDEHLKLIGQGSPAKLNRITADNPNARRFDRIACPIT